MWATLKGAGVEVPSLSQVKHFQLPDFVPPKRVCCIKTCSYMHIAVTLLIGSVSCKYAILRLVNFVNNISLPWKQQVISPPCSLSSGK